MKRVLILAEFFPPYENTAAFRPLNWYEEFYKHGLYPIVFCNNPNKAATEKETIEITPHGEVHRIAYNRNLPDEKIANAPNRIVKIWYILCKAFLGRLYTFNLVKEMFPFIDDYIKGTKIDFMIATGGPFALFGLANAINKKHKIPWIADYRDDWTTNEVVTSKLEKFSFTAHQSIEKEYVRSCSFITSVSKHYVNKIGSFVNRKGFVIENGYHAIEHLQNEKNVTQKLQLSYVGTLYPTQYETLNLLIAILDVLKEQHKILYKNLIINLVGLSVDTQADLATKLVPNFKLHISNNVICMLPIVPKKIALSYQSKADVLLFFSYYNPVTKKPVLGVPSSKLYEYIGFRKPILVFGNDNDIVFEKLTASKQGVFCTNVVEGVAAIVNFYEQKCNHTFLHEVAVPETVLIENSRKYQTEKLAKLIKNNIVDNNN
jgi:glycosyltransferase involved in cell wall biosynthesis